MRGISWLAANQLASQEGLSAPWSKLASGIWWNTWGMVAVTHQFRDMPQSACRHASTSVTTVNFRFVLGIYRSAATYRIGYHVSSQQDVKKQWIRKAAGLLTWHAFIVTLEIRETSFSTLRSPEITSLQPQESFLSQEAVALQAKISFAQSCLQ